MSALAFIPARGGSRRIPRKNARLLAGRPLLAYTVAAARDAGVFDAVVVSSDDAEILALARECGAETDERPPALGGDRVRFVEVLAEFLRRPAHARRWDSVAVLLPTCPFRTAADVRAAWALRAEAPDAFVVSVSPYDFPPEFACDLQCDGSLRLRHPEVYARSTQSQSVPLAHHPNGAIFLGPVARFLATESFYAPPVLGFPLPPERALDLDHPHQWTVAEALLAHSTP